VVVAEIAMKTMFIYTLRKKGTKAVTGAVFKRYTFVSKGYILLP